MKLLDECKKSKANSETLMEELLKYDETLKKGSETIQELMKPDTSTWRVCEVRARVSQGAAAQIEFKHAHNNMIVLTDSLSRLPLTIQTRVLHVWRRQHILHRVLPALWFLHVGHRHGMRKGYYDG